MILTLRSFAQSHGFHIHANDSNCKIIQFADGSHQRTVGQVYTSWNFSTGYSVPIICDVLEHCLHDVVLGEDLLWENNVFDAHALSINTLSLEMEDFELAPFSFASKWQRKLSKMLKDPTAVQKGDCSVAS